VKERHVNSLVSVSLPDLLSLLVFDLVGTSPRVVVDASMADVVLRSTSPNLDGIMGIIAPKQLSTPTGMRYVKELFLPSNPVVPMVAQVVSCDELIKDAAFLHELCSAKLADEAEVFTNPAVIAIIDYKWSRYGKYL
jgi:hypothetical protein